MLDAYDDDGVRTCVGLPVSEENPPMCFRDNDLIVQVHAGVEWNGKGILLLWCMGQWMLTRGCGGFESARSWLTALCCVILWVSHWTNCILFLYFFCFFAVTDAAHRCHARTCIHTHACAHIGPHTEAHTRTSGSITHTNTLIKILAFDFFSLWIIVGSFILLSINSSCFLFFDSSRVRRFVHILCLFPVTLVYQDLYFYLLS